MNMRNTLWVKLQESIHPSIQEFSTLTKPSISANPSRISSSSWVSTTTVTSSPTISSVHKWMLGTRPLTNVPRMSSIPMHLSVDDGMWGNVQWKHVSTSTSVQSVTHDTNQRTVLAQQQHMIWNGCVWIGHGVISGPHIIFHSHLLPLVQKWPPLLWMFLWWNSTMLLHLKPLLLDQIFQNCHDYQDWKTPWTPIYTP